MANEFALKSGGTFLSCFSLAPMRILDNGLEAWDYLVVGGHFAPPTSISNLRLSVEHRKHPLTPTSCHPGALTKELAGYDFSSLATVI
ncbi:hypothetical protein PoB_001195200 [Plakobranchus ocellatus]|uniref:Uncharacterized protein n=1 Tax=Plakobranchus ocellatus TaxID=259542 RepID=A0AAV3YTI6_9GAST|nr:hypothetical protein PoB_001195200 [Plakobranchus ocellatus]